MPPLKFIHTTFQSMINDKLSQQRLWNFQENRLDVKAHQTHYQSMIEILVSLQIKGNLASWLWE